MADNPYQVVVDALKEQSAAISELAVSIKTEFETYKAAVARGDEATANAIAASISAQTQKLVEITTKVSETLPELPPPGVSNELPGDQPEVGGGPIDRPGTPGDPVDRPGGQPDRPVAPDQPPGRPNRPDQGLPPGSGRPDAGLPPVPGTPPERPTPAPPTIDYVAPSSGKVNEDLVGVQVVGSLFYDGATVFLNGEPATKTIYVSENEVRFNDHIGTAGVVKVRVDDSNEVDFTVK